TLMTRMTLMTLITGRRPAGSTSALLEGDDEQNHDEEGDDDRGRRKDNRVCAADQLSIDLPRGVRRAIEVGAGQSVDGRSGPIDIEAQTAGHLADFRPGKRLPNRGALGIL